MTNKIRTALLICVIVSLVSCTKEKHEMWISIKNDTKLTINCKFYPTKSANGYKLTSVIDTSMKQVEMYSSANLNQKPEELLKSAYDSIIVTISSLNKDLLSLVGNKNKVTFFECLNTSRF